MAVRKPTKETKVEEVVEVVATEVQEEVVETQEIVEEVQEVETEAQVEIVAEVQEPKTDLVVDTESAKESERAEGKVKIRMRVDHKCCIAMERYDLKAGKTYTVPENVKRILNKAGLLAPL